MQPWKPGPFDAVRLRKAELPDLNGGEKVGAENLAFVTAHISVCHTCRTLFSEIDPQDQDKSVTN